MYEDYTRQALPSKRYREVLGTAVTVFNQNNAFVIENYLNVQTDDKFTWYKLIDFDSGTLKREVRATIVKNGGKEFIDLFGKIINSRNRIIHGFQVTNPAGEQVLWTKDKNTQTQFEITEDYLMNFIKDNQSLSDKLYAFRGH